MTCATYMAATTLGLAWLAATAQLSAQQWCSLSGYVLDSSAGTVPEAMVSVINEDTGFRRLIQTRTDGIYAVASLQPGTYKVIVRKDGFHTVVRFGVRLDASQSARLDFQLVVGSVQETITVEGDVRWLDRGDASVGILINGDEAEQLPLNGHGLLSLIELAPGAVVTPATRGESGQFSVDGQRPNTNYFTVDGVSANTGVSGGGLPAQSTGGALPGMSAFGSLHNLISLEELQEMRVQVSTTVPQFGRLPGAQVSISSRSGANDFHGSLFDSVRLGALDATDWFASGLTEPNSSLPFNDLAASLGGPVRRNRTFFFVSYETLRLQQGFAWREVVPSLSVRGGLPAWAESVFSLYPAPNGPNLGDGLAEWTAWSNSPSHLDVGSVRIDHAITSHLTTFGRYNISPSSNEFGSAQVSRLDLHSQSLTLGVDWLAGPRTVLDLRANASSASLSSAWTQADPPAAACALEPVTSYFLGAAGSCDSLVRFSIGGVSQVIYGSEGEQRQSQVQIVQTASLNRGAHSIQVGSDFLQLEPERRDPVSSLSILADSVASAGNSSNLWIARSGPQDTGATVKEASVFGQDTWRVTSRLTAVYGLRWEFSPALMSPPTTNFLNPQTGMISPARQLIWQTTYKDFAPRLGLAYRLDSRGRTVARAGAGIYYDSSLSIATDLINGGPLTLSQYGSGRIAPFDSVLTFGFTPDLRLPLIKQWSATVEHAFGDYDTLSIGYVGATGRQLIRREMGGLGSSPDIWVALTTNDGASDYNALNVQYRRRLARGVQALVTYTWSHSLDDGSSDAGLYWAGSGQYYWSGSRLSLNSERGPSDFDIRHSVRAAFTYELPRRSTGRLARFTNGWAVDGIFLARTGFPIDVLDTGQFMGLTLANAFRPDLVSGQPIWILDASAPGGRRLNPAAFSAAPEYVQGNLGRNAITGFGMSQVDLALRREFSVRERRSVELRMEAFDALNHPNFADPVSFLASPLFGYSASMLNVMMGSGSPGSGLAPMFQAGGARSVEASVRFRF
jgi:Carboxypeptidase regulatory-like domain/TonB dependent receptor